MSKLLRLPNGNFVAPDMIGAIKQNPSKGVSILDNSNAMIDFIAEPDDDLQAMIVMALGDVMTDGRAWRQPNWSEALSAATKPVSKPTVAKPEMKAV